MLEEKKQIDNLDIRVNDFYSIAFEIFTMIEFLSI